MAEWVKLSVPFQQRRLSCRVSWREHVRYGTAGAEVLTVRRISASQFIGAPLKLVDPKFYDGYMAWTKESFAVLVTTMTQWWAPTVVRVSGDESMKGQLYQMEDGTLKCNFPHRLVLMANHQLYTDWLYLWWIAYTNKMHGRIYIILKESLKQVPIFGWGAQFYNFIFLSRKWETDRFRFRKHLNHLKDPKDPMWLLIFPEGTNLSAVTREKSKKWAEKTGIQDMKHQLLPRSTGLQFCLQELKSSTNWLYDCTIAYEGVPEGMYGQDIFTLRSSFFEGRPPKSVNLYWRRFRISDIPVDNDEAFSRWLTNRWREKDYILEHFYKHNHFPADSPAQAMKDIAEKKQPRNAKFIATEVKAGGWDEFLSIFGPITAAAGALSNVDMTEPLDFDALMGKVAQQQHINLLLGGASSKAGTSNEAIKMAMMAAQKRNPLPKPVIDKLMKNPPRTQEEMKAALMKSGNAAVAKKAAQAPGANAALPGKTAQEKIANANEAAQQALAKVGNGKARAIPPPNVRKTLPMTPMEKVITQPLSSFAMQKAASTVRDAAATRSREKGAALPGQSKPTQIKPAGTKTTANGVKMPTANKGTVNGFKTPAKPASVNGVPINGARRPSIQSNVSSNAPRKLASAKKQVTGKSAIGTQKYAPGKG